MFRASNFGPWVNYLDWAVKPKITPRTPVDFWGVQNRGTASVDWREYAAAFSDVDPDFEIDFGIIDDGLKALYYELVVKGIAAGGNCFGMALEAIYAWKEQSRLGRPLARFDNWSQVENDFNVKHAYQAGADAIWWIVEQFLGGNTHNPMGVFQSTWDAFNRGENPVVCIAQNYDFSGAPHAIMPISWDRNVTPWQVGVFDSNFPNQRRVLTVDPNANTFRYDGSSDGSRIYSGGEWSGGRFHYIPWSILNHQQRTPVWDAILLLMGGAVLIFGDSTEVASLVDDKNASLDGAQALNRDALSGKLLRVPGLSGSGPVKGLFYAGKQEMRPFLLNTDAMRVVATLQPPTATLPASRAGALHTALTRTATVRLPVASDAPSNAISGATLMQLARRKGVPPVQPGGATSLDTIRCALRGKANGQLDAYFKLGLRGLHVRGPVVTGEAVNVKFERMGARDKEVSIGSDRARAYTAWRIRSAQDRTF